MSNNITKTAAVLLLLLGFVGTAQATLLFYEPFDYPVSPLAGNTHPDGQTWTTTDSQSPQSQQVLSGSLTYPGLISTGNKVENEGNSFFHRAAYDLGAIPGVNQMWSTAGTYYMTYLLSERSGVILGGGNSYDASPGGTAISYFLQNASAQTQVTNIGDPGLDGGVHMYAVRLVNDGSTGNDTIDLVIDPNLTLGNPNWAAGTNLWSGKDLTRNDGTPDFLRIFGPNLGPDGSDYSLQGGTDEVRIATTWDEAVSGVVSVPTPTSVWNVAGAGNWDTNTSWSPVGVPNSNLSVAGFVSNPTSAATVTTILPVTVRGIVFDNSNSVTISGAGVVSLDGNGSVPSISVVQGSHDFTAPVTLVEPAIVNVAASSSLDFNNPNPLNLNGKTLTKIGPGTMSLNGAVTGSGSIVVDAGVVNGTGTITGTLTNSGGTVGPGNSVGTLAVTDYLQTSGSLEIEINSAAGPGSGHDVLNVTNALTINGGTIDVVLNFLPAALDSFDILNFTSTNVTLGDFNLPTIGSPVLDWDISQLVSDGILSVVSIAAPGDFSGNGSVGLEDYTIMVNNYFSTGQTFNLTGDVASPGGQGVGFGDGIVDIYDFMYFRETLFPGGASAFASALAQASAVPEPGTVMLLLLAFPVLLLRRPAQRKGRN